MARNTASTSQVISCQSLPFDLNLTGNMLGGTLPTTAEMRRLENHHTDLILQTGNFRELLLKL